MRIAQVAPVAMPIEPGAGDSIEQLVGLLSDELVRRGHEVTLFATGDSRTTARLSAVYERGYDRDEELWDWCFHETLNAAAAFERADEFDVIHATTTTSPCRSRGPRPRRRCTPTTCRRTRMCWPRTRATPGVRGGRVGLSALAARGTGQRDGDPARHRHRVFPFGADGGDHLLYLGRMIEDKGPLEAVRVARGSACRS